MIIPAFLAALLGAGPAIPWTHDYTKAFADAEEPVSYTHLRAHET